MLNKQKTYLIIGMFFFLVLIVFGHNISQQRTTKTIPETPKISVPDTKPANEKELTNNPQIEPPEQHNTQTYKNDVFGFSLQLPDNFVVTTDGGAQTVTIQTELSYGPTSVIMQTNKTITELIATEQQKMTQWQSEMPQEKSAVTSADIILAGKPAKEFLYISPVGFTERHIIVQQDKQRTLYITTFKNSIFDEIFDSLQFLP